MRPIIKKRATVAVICFFIFLGAIFAYSYIKSFQHLHLDFETSDPNLRARIYSVNLRNHDVSPEHQIDKNKPVKEVAKDEEVRLKKGDYLVIVSGSNDYEEQDIELVLGDKPEKVAINPNFSATKLGLLLAEQKSGLRRLINTHFPSIRKDHKIDHGKLYQHGEWYGTTIRPNLSAEQLRLRYVDIYRVVLYRENNSWKIVTKPPELLLSGIKYPNIPLEVLQDVNRIP